MSRPRVIVSNVTIPLLELNEKCTRLLMKDEILISYLTNEEKQYLAYGVISYCEAIKLIRKEAKHRRKENNNAI